MRAVGSALAEASEQLGRYWPKADSIEATRVVESAAAEAAEQLGAYRPKAYKQ